MEDPEPETNSEEEEDEDEDESLIDLDQFDSDEELLDDENQPLRTRETRDDDTDGWYKSCWQIGRGCPTPDLKGTLMRILSLNRNFK